MRKTLALVLWAGATVGALVHLGQTETAYGAANTVNRTNVPPVLNFQGVLRNLSGNPVPDGSYNMTFSLWSDSVAGAELWTETQAVLVAGSVLDASLGQSISLPQSVYSSPLYLQIQVGGDPPLSRRIRLLSTPYALISSAVSGDIVTGPGELLIPQTTPGHKYVDIVSADSLVGLQVTDNNVPAKCAMVVDTGGAVLTLNRDSSPGMESILNGYVGDRKAVMDLYAGGGLGAGSFFDVSVDGKRERVDMTMASGGGFATQSYFDAFADAMGGTRRRVKASPNTIQSFFDVFVTGGRGALSLRAGHPLGVGSQFEVLAATDTCKVALHPGEGGAPQGAFCDLTVTEYQGRMRLGPANQEYLIAAADTTGGYLTLRTPAGDTCVILSQARNFLEVFHGPTLPPGSYDRVGWDFRPEGMVVVGKDNMGTVHDTNAVLSAYGDLNLRGACSAAGGAALGPGSVHFGTTSVAAGRNAKANHTGTFVWGDDQATNVVSTGSNQFVVRASGGVWMGTNDAVGIPAVDFLSTSTGAHLTTGGVWTNSCDAARKENFTSVDRGDLLERIAALPITRWNYKGESAQVQHIGPTGQDFYRLFGLGTDEKSISTIDPPGVALAAIQALYEQQKSENRQLREQIAELREMIRAQADKRK